jgi:hypothetical protein
MAIQFIVGFNERNLKLGSRASHRLEQSEEGAQIDYGTRGRVM